MARSFARRSSLFKVCSSCTRTVSLKTRECAVNWGGWGSGVPILRAIGQLHDDDIWLQLPEFISFLLCYLNLPIPLRIKNNNLNLHKKTTHSRILVAVVKWRHRAIVLFLIGSHYNWLGADLSPPVDGALKWKASGTQDSTQGMGTWHCASSFPSRPAEVQWETTGDDS